MTVITARQLKDKISNLSGGNSTKAQMLIRRYMMERFLARIAASPYKSNFILKGGMLVSSLLGVNARSTMDIDTTVKALNVSADNALRIISEIAVIDLDDGLRFEAQKAEEIMEEHDYPGIRITLTVYLQNLKDTIKLDISTGDDIVPAEIEIDYAAMFDGEKINVLSYTTETVLAEKLETLLARSVLNTRMRDFYDLHMLWTTQAHTLDYSTLSEAVYRVGKRRNTLHLLDTADKTVQNIENSAYMKQNWENYKANNYYVGDTQWKDVLSTVRLMLEAVTADLGARR